MKLSRFVVSAVGEFSWRPPAWLQRAGPRRVGYGVATLVAAAALAVGGYLYYESLPKPLQVQVEVDAPGLSRIERGELVVAPLHLDFAYPANQDETPPPLSAARLDLVGNVIEEGVELDPPMPGEWTFATENRLAFEPAEDWPADREYRVRLSPDLFAPDIELASDVVEFQTPPFVAELLEASFYQHPEIVAERRVTASFGFSHAVARDDFEQRLTLAMREGLEECPPPRRTNSASASNTAPTTAPPTCTRTSSPSRSARTSRPSRWTRISSPQTATACSRSRCSHRSACPTARATSASSRSPRRPSGTRRAIPSRPRCCPSRTR